MLIFFIKNFKFKIHYVQYKQIENMKYPSPWIKIINYFLLQIILLFDYYTYYKSNTLLPFFLMWNLKMKKNSIWFNGKILANFYLKLWFKRKKYVYIYFYLWWSYWTINFTHIKIYQMYCILFFQTNIFLLNKYFWNILKNN